jgi:hypothetical protein
VNQTNILKDLFRFVSNPKVLLACCAFIQFPFIASQPPFCFAPPFFESHLGFAIGLFLAAYGIYQNTYSGNIAALGLGGLLFYKHFYSIPIQMMEISQKSAWEICSALPEFWAERIEYSPAYGLQMSFTTLLFCVALFCLAHKLFYKRLTSI